MRWIRFVGAVVVVAILTIGFMRVHDGLSAGAGIPGPGAGAKARPPDETHTTGSATQREGGALDPEIWRRAQDVARQILTIDPHSHDLYAPPSPQWPKQVTFPMMVTGGLGGLVQVLPTQPTVSDLSFDAILSDIRTVKSRIAADGQARLALSAADFARIRGTGRPAVMIALEYFFGLLDARVESLDSYYREGVRILRLYPGGKDQLANGDALNEFGRQVVAAMNRLGMACDLTHLSAKVRREVAEVSRAPVLMSHSAVATLVPSGFNLDDATIDLVAAKHGLIGITFCSEQISKEILAQRDTIRETIKKGTIKDPTTLSRLPRARAERVVDHIDYVKKRWGLEAVAFGSDYGGSGRLAPTGLETSEGLPLLVYHMLKRGYSEKEIARVMGGNFVSFLERVERAKSSEPMDPK